LKLKAIILSSLVALSLVLSGCGASLRFTKDVYITAISPVMVPMAATGDAYRGATDIREGYQSGAWTEIVAFPVLFVWHAVKHTCFVGVHFVDAFFYPFYGLSELSALGPEIKPIDYYGNTWVDRIQNSKSKADYEKGRKMSDVGVDADTGETRR
jgi:predicted small secreted protein